MSAKPLTRELLLSWGFTPFNSQFTYLLFPPPHYGNYRIDINPDTNQWYVFYAGSGEDVIIGVPQTDIDLMRLLLKVHEYQLVLDDKPAITQFIEGLEKENNEINDILPDR